MGFNFLGLSTELRSLVYANMSPPLNNHIDVYEFILSCKQLKAEAEGEMVHHMKMFFKAIIMKVWDKTHNSPLVIKMPTTIAEIENVDVCIPKSALRVPCTFHYATPAAFLPLRNLHITSLAFHRHEDEKN